MSTTRRMRLCAIILLASLTSAIGGEGEFIIEASDFDDGNVRVSRSGQTYADGASCIWNGGELPNRADYVVEFPVAADYALSGLYAAAESRTVEIILDGKQVHRGFAGVTGSWNTSSAQWEPQCVLRLSAGTHTLLLRREGPMPHICALRLKSSVPFPAG